MVRTYKKTPGTRAYKNYTEEDLEEALQKITDGELSIHAASIQYRIPFGTLYNRYKGLHTRTVGGQTVFTHAEEKALLRAAATCADWGFPLTALDLRMIAKAYLDKQGKNVSKFSNNLPGHDWALSVLKRHKDDFSQRVASNIKKARAKVGPDSINEYFEHLKTEVEGIPPSNIFNYDESNLSDDPGKKRCIYRRSVKYPERVMNFSKSCTSIMICGSADGVLLPPYVIYRSTHLYDTWKERGIVGKPCCPEPCCSRGSRYNRTQSGWIDGPTFRDWFLSTFLPHANRLEGPKVIIGDNLSSHLDEDVLKTCQENNIRFICLVPNSTHICQPLDVGFFRPMKTAWRKMLEIWKSRNPKMSTVAKDAFPSLLKEGLIQMDQVPSKKDSGSLPENNSAISRNLISSFEATGIYPWNKDKVLNKLPRVETEADNPVRDVLVSYLKDQRYGNEAEPSRKKRTRLHVEPGKSVATVDSEESEENGDEDTDEGQEMDTNEAVEDKDEEGEITETDVVRAGPSNEDECDADSDTTRCDGPQIGSYVLAKFQSTKGKKTYKYVCVIEDVSENKIVVKGLKSVKKDKTKFRVVEDDISIIDETDIIMYLPQPEFRRNIYVFPADINILEL